jgi:hypothetical protein
MPENSRRRENSSLKLSLRFFESTKKATGKEKSVIKKPTPYQERVKLLRGRAKDGNMKAMEELHKRYHINELMINEELVNLKEKFAEHP